MNPKESQSATRKRVIKAKIDEKHVTTVAQKDTSYKSDIFTRIRRRSQCGERAEAKYCEQLLSNSQSHIFSQCWWLNSVVSQQCQWKGFTFVGGRLLRILHHFCGYCCRLFPRQTRSRPCGVLGVEKRSNSTSSVRINSSKPVGQKI